MRAFRFLAIVVALAGGLASVGHDARAAGRSIPAPPYYYVLDEPHVLSQGTLQSVQKLLIEHDRATGEQILVAIFKNADGEDPVLFANRVYQTWKIGKRGEDKGALLALYWDEHKARIEVGYGLEAVLTDAKSKDVIEDTLVPELKQGDPGRAISLSALQILTIIGSPLVENGEAQRILRGGGLSGPMHARPVAMIGGGWFPWLFLGFILMIIVLNLLTAGDAHFTSGGWYRPTPFSRRRWGGGVMGGFGGGFWGGGGGGIFGGGGGGGGGGFIGGGGSSGGGGASGSW